jgi:CDP-diacylglycerol---glycerol-3-phosphate 3-phosphatidyltransferase
MLNNPAARKVASVVIEPPARALIRMHVSPDAVTVVGTIGAVSCAMFLIGRGEFVWGVIGITIFALADLLDGTMARMLGTQGPWGNFLDASLDRVADGAIFGSVAYWGATQGNMWLVSGALVALVAGQVTSYSKARAEAVGASANVGIVERAERLIAIGAALLVTGILGYNYVWILTTVVWILAVLGIVTVIQRFVHVRSQLKNHRAS